MTEQEKNNFVSFRYLTCKADFVDFKKNNHYWLEYTGNDRYLIRDGHPKYNNSIVIITEEQLLKYFE